MSHTRGGEHAEKVYKFGNYQVSSLAGCHSRLSGILFQKDSGPAYRTGRQAGVTNDVIMLISNLNNRLFVLVVIPAKAEIQFNLQWIPD